MVRLVSVGLRTNEDKEKEGKKDVCTVWPSLVLHVNIVERIHTIKTEKERV